MLKKSVCLLLALIALNGCTRDDICASETQTTPLLVIRFLDISNPQLPKAVPNLTVETADNNQTEVISRTTTDSIAIPLSAFSDLTRYRFISDDDGNNPNTDVVTFQYTREDLYVNRACAFKTIFRELEMEVQNEGTANWILITEIQNNTIEDETLTHITILH